MIQNQFCNLKAACESHVYGWAVFPQNRPHFLMALVQLSESCLSNSPPSPMLEGGCAPGLCDQVLEEYQPCFLSSKYKPCFQVLCGRGGAGGEGGGQAAGRGSVNAGQQTSPFPRMHYNRTK